MVRFFTYLVKFLPALISTVITFVSVFPASNARLEEEIAGQIQRIEALEEAYTKGEIAPVDEASFFAGDLNAELEAGIKFNEISFLGTHNSYQSESTDEVKKLYQNLSGLTFGLLPENKGEFKSETLTDQLNSGIRSLEIDIEVFDRDGDVSFTCMHSPSIEMTTTCYNFELAMKEIAMWSNNNPDHLPVTIILEPKEFFLPLEDMKKFSIDYADEIDKALRETLGEKLFTPADMLRDYDSFGEMRKADDWCKVSDMQGKVLILLHDCGATEDYIKLDPSLKSQAMFPMLRQGDIERDCASFIIANEPDKLLKQKDKLTESKVILRTRCDSFGNAPQERFEQAMATPAHIISTDYPPRTDNTADSYIVSFGGRTTVRKITQ